MHEQSIVESVLALVIENAQKAQATRVLKVNLVIGALSGVVEDAVILYFNFLSQNTIASGAVLSFHSVAAQLRCRPCDAVFPFEGSDLRCPTCGQRNVEIVSGRELYVDSLEVA